MLHNVQKEFTSTNTAEEGIISTVIVNDDPPSLLANHPQIKEHFKKVKGLKSKILSNKSYLQSARDLSLDDSLIADIEAENNELIKELTDRLGNITCSDALYAVVKTSTEKALESLINSVPQFFDHLNLWNNDNFPLEFQEYILQKLSNKIHEIASEEVGLPIFKALVETDFKGPDENGMRTQGGCDFTLRKNEGQTIISNLHPDISKLDGIDAIDAVFHEAAHSVHAQLGHHLVFYPHDPEVQKLIRPFADDALYVFEMQVQDAYITPEVDQKAYESSAGERLAQSAQKVRSQLIEKYEIYLDQKIEEHKMVEQSTDSAPRSCAL